MNIWTVGNGERKGEPLFLQLLLSSCVVDKLGHVTHQLA